jgi:type I restriction enzyme S subunit
VKPGYKQTEVGVIPENWKVEPFQALAHIERGKFTARPRNDPKYYGGEIPFIQTGDVTNSSGWIKMYSQTLNQEGLKVSKLFRRGTLFFTIAANIGDVGFAGFDTACPDSLVAITPVKRIDKHWLAHELRMRKPSFENLASHNAQLNISLEKLRPYLLPVPPPAEQEAIAEALNDADALIESLEQLLAKKRQVKQGAMQELLTGQKRLPGFSGQWAVKRLGDLVEIQKGELITEKNAVPGVIPVIAGGKQPAYFHDCANRSGKTITISASGANAGYVAFHRTPIFASDCSTIGEGANYSVEFIYFLLLLSQGAIYKAQTGGAQPHIHPNDLRPLLISVPETMDEQSAIAAILSDMDEEIVTLEAKHAKARQLKQGMMQELLTGRIRLV